jgi:hypothetical protein
VYLCYFANFVDYFDVFVVTPLPVDPNVQNSTPYLQVAAHIIESIERRLEVMSIQSSNIIIRLKKYFIAIVGNIINIFFNGFNQCFINIINVWIKVLLTSSKMLKQLVMPLQIHL